MVHGSCGSTLKLQQELCAVEVKKGLQESRLGGNTGPVCPNVSKVIRGGELTAPQVKNVVAEKLKEKFESGGISENDYMDGLLADMDDYLDTFFTVGGVTAA